MNAISRQTVVRPAANLFHTALPGQQLLLDTAGHRYFALDGVGARAWELMALDRPLSAVHATLQEEFDVTAERLWEDLATLVAELADHGLVDLADQSVQPPGAVPELPRAAPARAWAEDVFTSRELEGLLRVAGSEMGLPVRFRAHGACMWPAIRDGDVVTVTPLGVRKPARGEVVVFRRPGSDRLLLHRVASVAGETMLVRGDNAGAPDGVVAARDALGVVSALERSGQPAGVLSCPTTAWGKAALRFYLSWLDARFALISVVARGSAAFRGPLA